MDLVQAMNMPQAFDNAWSAIGGGPADLVYPEEFLGRWLTESTLTKVEMPLGPSFVPNLQVTDPCCWQFPCTPCLALRPRGIVEDCPLMPRWWTVQCGRT